jgi:hypothetical protein
MTTPRNATGIVTQTVCLAVPLLPGRTDADRDAMASCWAGERRADHAASRRRHGITRESVWIQATPGGDMAVILLEARDLGAALGGIATSSEPFDVWFREHVADVHGIDLAGGVPLPEQVLDFRG